MALRDELAALHRVYEQEQLGIRKLPSRQCEFHGRALIFANIHTGIAQGGDVPIDSLAFGANALFLQKLDYGAGRQPDLLVGLLHEQLRNCEQPFLPRFLRHGISCPALRVARLLPL